MQSQIASMVSEYERGGLSRRQLIARLSGLVAAVAAAPVPLLAQVPAPPPVPAPAPVAGQEAAPTFTAVRLNHIALRTTDVDRSVEFYRRHLGLEIASRSRSSCFLRCRESDFLALFKSDMAGMHHSCYSVEGFDPGGAMQRLEAAGLKPRRQDDRVYFDDPDGLEVQVAAKSHAV